MRCGRRSAPTAPLRGGQKFDGENCMRHSAIDRLLGSFDGINTFEQASAELERQGIAWEYAIQDRELALFGCGATITYFMDAQHRDVAYHCPGIASLTIRRAPRAWSPEILERYARVQVWSLPQAPKPDDGPSI